MRPAFYAHLWIIAVSAIAAVLILASRCTEHEQRLRRLEAPEATPTPTPAVLFRLGPSDAPVGEEGERAPMA